MGREKFKAEDLDELAWRQPGDIIDTETGKLESMSNRIVEHGRWHVLHQMVFKQMEAGCEDRYFQVMYRDPATENQDCDRFNGVEVECTEVAPKEVTVIKYEPV